MRWQACAAACSAADPDPREGKTPAGDCQQQRSIGREGVGQMGDRRLPVWELLNITKEFPGVRAIDGLSLAVYEGEVHALVGGNGSGKSTLIKCLSGVHQPDAGEIRLRGKTVVIHSPMVARSLGVATIFQEFSLVPTLTVAENIFLGRLPLKPGTGVVDWAEMRTKALEVLNRLEVAVDPDAVVKDLSVAEQQLIEIAKAISADARLLIMDEPTAALGMTETRRLHKLVRRMAEDGCAIIYISHRIAEVVEIADRVTIMKDGRVVGSADKAGLDVNYIVRTMVGNDVREHYPKVCNRTDRPLLRVENIRTARGVNGVSFEVNRGEVFGLGGMTGSGRTEIARALFGVDRLLEGRILINDVPVKLGSPGDAIRAGIAYVPENRRSDGLFFNLDSAGNITIARLSALIRWGLLSLTVETEVSRSLIDTLRLHASALVRSVRLLSGGNQQKLIIARWLFSQAELLVLDEPTQGIDVAAKVEVYRLIGDLTAQGKAVILISSDFPELLAISDRVGIVRSGRITRIAEASELDEMAIVQD